MEGLVFGRWVVCDDDLHGFRVGGLRLIHGSPCERQPISSKFTLEHFGWESTNRLAYCDTWLSLEKFIVATVTD
jgi:hypothetical protein